MDNKKTNRILILALVIGLVFHLLGSVFTYEKTYDAFVHIFFADHYQRSLLDPWEPRWYTGFLMVSYPPLVHQTMSVVAYMIGLKMSFVFMGVVGILVFVTGIYRTTRVITGSRSAAAYASLAAALSTTIIEALHVYGQLPSLWGISLLLHMLPELYRWIRSGQKYHLLTSLLLLSTTVASHHVTVIFGMAFFILPMMSVAVMDRLLESGRQINSSTFVAEGWRLRGRILSWGLLALVLIVAVIFPYWSWSRTDPIAQVPIPHGSRENFLSQPNLGLMFFVIPWGMLMLFLPYFFYRYFSKRNLFLGISLSLLTLLGTGGTTPLPRMILGEYAFNILTLERFTFWATILCLPLMGELISRFQDGDFDRYLSRTHRLINTRSVRFSLITAYVLAAVITLFLTHFRPGQPDRIKTKPIENFLKQDEHDAWRYITLGFGDQMAWLSTQVDAYTIDGNYHSARRLPELTSRPVERLENSKFGDEVGLETLREILSNANRFHLKYVFSNDKFYAPLLHFNGWQKISTLENGVVIWERPQISKLPSSVVRTHTSPVHNILWAVVPLAVLVLMLVFYGFRHHISPGSYTTGPGAIVSFQPSALSDTSFRYATSFAAVVLGLMIFALLRCSYINYMHHGAVDLIKKYFMAMDSKDFSQAYDYVRDHEDYPIEQFMLEIHTQDGLLNSYGKLKSITTKKIEESDGYRRYAVHTVWSTPLRNITHRDTLQLTKNSGQWKILPKKYNTDIPSEQFFNTVSYDFYNQGRRKTSVNTNHFENALDQPSLDIPQTHITYSEGKYYIVGEIKNTSNRPANLFVSAMIYDENEKLEYTECTSAEIKYLLLPQEETSFMIALDSIKNFEKKSINLFINSEASFNGKYPYASITRQQSSDSSYQVSIYNYGNQEITIPQIILNYYNAEGQIIWVQNEYGLHSIKPKRNQYESVSTKKIQNIKVLSKNINTLMVNNIARATNQMPKRYFDEVRIDLNAYIGNEK